MSGTGGVREEGSEAARLTSSSRAGPPRRAGGSVFGRRVLRGRPPGDGPTRLSPLACLLRPRETARQESLAALSSCCEGSSKLLIRWRTTSSWKEEQTRSFACCCDESWRKGRGGRPKEKDVVGGRRRRDGSQPTLLGGLYSQEPTSREAARLHDILNWQRASDDEGCSLARFFFLFCLRETSIGLGESAEKLGTKMPLIRHKHPPTFSFKPSTRSPLSGRTLRSATPPSSSPPRAPTVARPARAGPSRPASAPGM